MVQGYTAMLYFPAHTNDVPDLMYLRGSHLKGKNKGANKC